MSKLWDRTKIAHGIADTSAMEYVINSTCSLCTSINPIRQRTDAPKAIHRDREQHSGNRSGGTDDFYAPLPIQPTHLHPSPQSPHLPNLALLLLQPAHLVRERALLEAHIRQR